MYDIIVRYEDGRRMAIEHGLEDLGEACARVLKLADELGDKPGDGDGPAKAVEIYRDERLEISVSVVHGGLIDRKMS
jgi:hypothetical protein